MKKLLLASVSTVIAAAFMSDVCETVLIKGGKDGPVRVNKSDFEADKKENGGKGEMKEHTADDAEQSIPSGTTPLPLPEGVIQRPAPAAPDFNSGNGSETPSPVPPLNIDETTGAAMPTAPSPGQKLVLKEGTAKKPKYFVTDHTGVKLHDFEGIDNDGYDTEQDAWNAILALPH